MKAADLRSKNTEELNAELLKLREEQFRLRLQKATGQLGQSHLMRSTQRDIARVKTIITEKAGS